MMAKTMDEKMIDWLWDVKPAHASKEELVAVAARLRELSVEVDEAKRSARNLAHAHVGGRRPSAKALAIALGRPVGEHDD